MDQPAVQRVCPYCARISYEDGRRCPYCGRSFRRSILPAVAAMLTVFAVVVLGGVALMLLAFGNELEGQLDREVRRVERDIEGNFEQIRRDVREELDRRLPPNPSLSP